MPFPLEVEVLLQPAQPQPAPSVEKLRGLSAPLDGTVLGFPKGEPGQRCRLTLLLREAAGALPACGRLLEAEGRPLPAGYSGECSAVLQAGIRYQHTAATASPGRDCIPARLSVLPAPSSGSTSRCWCGSAEGPTTRHPSPCDPQQQGFLLSTDDLSCPLIAFSQQEVRELKIAYQPPTLDSDQERLFQVEMEVLDPDSTSSEPFAFMILVKPMNTLAPVATFSHVASPQLMLFEGQSQPLSGNLEISDEDNLKEVKVWVARGLQYGTLAAGLVVYQHDGSEHS